MLRRAGSPSQPAAILTARLLCNRPHLVKKTLALFVLVLLPFSVFAQQPDFKKLVADLGKTPRQHPYLIFSADEKPAMLQRIKADRHALEILEKLELEGRRYLYATVQPEAPRREIHTRYVGSDDYRRFVAENLDAATTLAFLYQLNGDAKYAAKAYEYAVVVAQQESWVQSPHTFDVIYSRVWPFGAKDDEVVFTYDITASSVSQKMSYIYDWLYTALDKHQRDRIRAALLDKAITRVRGNYEYFWWATAYKCNWSGICHTGLGLSALALLDEDPQLTDVVARSCEGIWNMIEHIGEDGGWQEGRGYWAYGLGESVLFMEAVKRATGGEVNFFKHRSLYPHPEDFGLYGMTAGFGDGTGMPVGESFVMNKLAQESGDPAAAYYVQRYVRPLDGLFDLIWPATTVKPEKPKEASKLFKSIDWAVLRKDFGPEYMTIATKAGMNDDPHHGHLDCGTVCLTWQGLNFVGEVPRTPYDEKYFGEMRWDYLEARTSGHNVVMVNGEEQAEAKLKDQPWKTGIGGHITQYASEPSFAYVAMDPTHAYPGKELKQWNRWIVLDKDQNITIVLDKVGCAVGSEIEVRYHPGVENEVLDNRVVLHPVMLQPDIRGRQGANTAGESAPATARAGARANRNDGEHRYTSPADTVNADNATGGRGGNRRSDLEMLPLFNGAFTVIKGRQPDVPITEEDRLTWVPYFSTLVKAPTTDNVIASVFYPAELKGREGNGIQFKLESENGNPVVSYTLQGKAVKYSISGDGKITRTTP